MAADNRYSRIIERIFADRYQAGATAVEFPRAAIEEVARQMGIALPKNLGDVVYSFRYRASLPVSVQQTAPPGTEWVIRPAGRAVYRSRSA